jgi:DUF4097 and DUF4098 domain-containing protein YvlB
MRPAHLLRAATRLGPALALSACTLNVQPVDRTIVARATEDVTTLRTDLEAADLGHAAVVVGPTDEVPTVGLVVRGLLAFDRPIDDVLSRIRAEFDTASTPTGLRFSLEATREEAISVEEIELALRRGTALDLTTTRGSVEVRGLESDARIVATSGSIDVSDALDVELRATSGSIRVEGRAGVLEAGSGSIDLDLTGAVEAHATSGSIHGRFGGGGELGCSSGSLDLELIGPLDRDLTLTASSGSITLVVPPDLAARVEARADSGSVDVSVGAVQHDGEDFVGELGEGGTFVIRATADSGSVHIVERGR